MMEREITVAVVGATGAVGSEVVRTLEERVFPVGDLRLFASSRTAGPGFTWRIAEITRSVYIAASTIPSATTTE